jgi:hypothetical protein
VAGGPSPGKTNRASVPTVDDILKKWSPLTEGLGYSEARRLAWVLEGEACYLHGAVACYLHGAVDGPKLLTIKPALEFIFPLIRRVVPRITVLERIVFSTNKELSSYVRGALREELSFIMRVYLDSGKSVDGADQVEEMFDAITARIMKSLQEYPG